MNDDIVQTTNQDNNEWQLVQRIRQRNNNVKRTCKVAPLVPLVLSTNNDSSCSTAVPSYKYDNCASSLELSCIVQNQSLSTFKMLPELRSRDIKQYYSFREVSCVVGFVVNIHDATNFDIDLQLTTKMQNKYSNAITNNYTYNDLGNEYLTNPSTTMNKTLVPQTGTTYRCRLRGIGINRLPSNVHIYKSHIITADIKQLIDRTDNWISCTLSDIDVYQRLLVDIFVHTVDGCVNIRDYLLQKMVDNSVSNEIPLFYAYTNENRENRENRENGQREY